MLPSVFQPDDLTALALFWRWVTDVILMGFVLLFIGGAIALARALILGDRDDAVDPTDVHTTVPPTQFRAAAGRRSDLSPVRGVSRRNTRLDAGRRPR